MVGIMLNNNKLRYHVSNSLSILEVCDTIRAMALELELKKLGLSDKEAKVYLALLELSEAPVQKIAGKAKVNRATTYVILESLHKKGAVTTLEKNKKVMFAAESPRTLLSLFKSQEQELRDKQEEFKKILPELEAIFNLAIERPIVRFFEDIEAVRIIREEIIASGAKVIYDIYSLEYVNQIYSLFSKEENNDFLKKRKELGITIKAIYTSDTGPFKEFQLKGERKFVPKDKFPFSADILIYKNKVALTTLRGKIITVIIESKEIADTLRIVFELAWLGADNIKRS